MLKHMTYFGANPGIFTNQPCNLTASRFILLRFGFLIVKWE